MPFRPPATDLEVLEKAASISTGGMTAFTAHFFSPVGGKPRWDLTGSSPDSWDLKAGEYVPWEPLPWQYVLAHDSRMDATVIAGFGAGKTIGVAACASYWCMLIPRFKFMNCSMVGWQAKQMWYKVRDDLVDWENRGEHPRYITPYIKKFIERPYPRVEFINGSSMEFMSGDEQGQKIRSWEGDVASIDEAGLIDNLDELVENLGSRLRGVTGGRQRLGKLILLSNAEYCPELWEQFDMAKELPHLYYSIALTIYDNPYLTKSQVEAIERRIKDPTRRRQLLLAERPMPRGKEFTPSLLERARDVALDENMAHHIERGTPGYRREEMQRAGIWRWETPYNPHHKYILVGDPGQAMPPNRNSPCIMVFQVTNFPDEPAELAAFWWGDGKGSYWPFIYKFEDYYRTYKPFHAGFDATGIQKGMDELVFQQRGLLVEGISMQQYKMQMVVTLKLLMGRDLFRMPKEIAGIWLQLAGWHMPDRKLKQDIASTLFMVAHVLQRLFVLADQPEMGEADISEDVRSERNRDVRTLRQERHRRMRR